MNTPTIHKKNINSPTTNPLNNAIRRIIHHLISIYVIKVKYMIVETTINPEIDSVTFKIIRS